MTQKNTNSVNKDIASEEREELLNVLKARFEKNMHRHQGIEWEDVQAKLDANPQKLWSLNEMEKAVVNQMLLVMLKRRMSIFFMIVQRKVQKVAGVFAMTVRHWRLGKSTNQKIVLWIWQQSWELNF